MSSIPLTELESSAVLMACVWCSSRKDDTVFSSETLPSNVFERLIRKDCGRSHQGGRKQLRKENKNKNRSKPKRAV